MSSATSEFQQQSTLKGIHMHYRTLHFSLSYKTASWAFQFSNSITLVVFVFRF